jgi:hypothetical protein
MNSGSEWALIWNERPVEQGQSAELFIKRASDPDERAYSFKVGANEARPMIGFTFQVFGRLAKEPATPLYWQLEATGGLKRALRIEVWWMEVPLGSGLRALRTHEPMIGTDRKVIEITGAAWESSIDRAKRGLRALDMSVTGSGGRHKTPKEKKVDALAQAGLKWMTAHTDYRVEDVGRDEWGQATGRGRVGVDKHMGRAPKVFNSDVHDRMHELIREAKSMN